MRYLILILLTLTACSKEEFLVTVEEGAVDNDTCMLVCSQKGDAKTCAKKIYGKECFARVNLYVK